MTDGVLLKQVADCGQGGYDALIVGVGPVALS
jgi:hypothetical protein